MFLYNPFRHDSRVLKEARTLAEAGHDVRIVAVGDAGTPAREERDGFSVIRVDRDPLPTKLLRALLSAADRSRAGRAAGTAAGSRAPAPLLSATPDGRLVRLVRRTHIAWDHLKFLRLAYGLVRREPADVYFAHDLETLPVAVLAKRSLGGRVLYDSHELFVEHTSTVPARTRLWKPFWRLLERELIRHADQVVTVCQPIAVELSRRYGVPEPAVVLNVPDRTRHSLERRDLRTTFGIDVGITLVLYLGALLPHRGIEPTIRSLALLQDAAFVVMGPGSPDYVVQLRAFTAAAGVQGRVHFAQPVPADEVVSWASGADVGVCVIESIGLNNHYSLPNKLFEYLAAGVAIVASDIPTMRQIVEAHGVGVTCDPTDPAAIAHAIRSVVDDPSRHFELRRRALEASDSFTWEREGAKLLALVERLGPAHARHAVSQGDVRRESHGVFANEGE